MRKKYVLGVIVPGIVFGAVATVFLAFSFVRLEWLKFPDSWSPGLVTFIRHLVTAVLVALIGALPVVLLTWLERKVVARIQDRIGPNVAGPWGMIVALADAVKMFTKEDTTPSGADRVMFNAAPILMGTAAWMLFGILPFAPGLVGIDDP